MRKFGKDLKVYADNGFRSAADWLERGRQVGAQSAPRASAESRGERIDLFTRDQTEPRERDSSRQ